MTIEYSNMFQFTQYKTPTKRQRGVAVQPLNVEVTSRLDQGLMTPLSANSHAFSRSSSAGQTSWDGSFQDQKLNYSLGHPNTPVQGLDNEQNFIDQYDGLHIEITGGEPQQGLLPTPTSSICTPSYNGSFRFEGSEMLSRNTLSSPAAGAMQQPVRTDNNFMWSDDLPITQSCGPESSFASSVGLSAFDDLKLETASASSFSTSSLYDTSDTMFSLSGSIPMSGQAPTHDSQSRCIVPMQTLEDPMQDLSQYMNHDWHNDSSADVGYSMHYGHSSPVSQLLSPVSTPAHDARVKMDPYLSSSPEPFQVVRSTPKTKTATRRVKKEHKRRRGLRTFKGRTDDGSLVECSVDEKALKKICGDLESKYSKIFPCDFASCDAKFARSEHQKRHMKSHDPVRPFGCYIEGCKAGGARSGAVARADNANDHAYTHLKAWISGTTAGSVELSRLWGISTKKSKARNLPVSPKSLRDRIIQRNADEPERYTKWFNTFNRKASDDFEIHINFAKDDCPMTRCLFKRGSDCRICREVRTK